MADKKKAAPTKASTEFDPATLVQTAFLMGVGALEMTREKLGELSDDLVAHGKMSKSEAKRVSDRVSKMAKEQEAAVRDTVEKETKKAMKASGLASKEDVAALKAEIAGLKAELAAARGGKPAAKKAPAKKKAAAKKPAAKGKGA